jgi:hypothetical protein
MALTSTSFMAEGGHSVTLSNKLDKIDCSQVLSAVLLKDTALLGHIRMGASAENIEVNWIEDELNPAYILAKSVGATVMTVSTGKYTTASLARFLRGGTILQPSGKNFLVQMASTCGKETGVTIAAYGGIAKATWAMTKCYIVAQPYKDISSASTDSSQLRQKRKNFTQIFERAVEITQSRKGIAMEAVVDELQTQIKYRTFEIKRELNTSVLLGQPKGTSSYAGTAEDRTMAGILCLIRDYDLDHTEEDDMVINAAAALSVGLINTLAYKIFEAGGLDETSDPIIVVGPTQARVIAAFEKELRRVEQGERTVGFYRNVFLSDMGKEFPIVIDRWMPKDKLLILDRSRVALRSLINDAWHLEKMAKTGRNEKWQLSGQYTIELRNADKCHGFMYGLT